MGILDEAIREHLELKRQHGADEPELKQLEDEAFGPPERPGDEAEQPDPLAEAPTEFMVQPDAPPEAGSGEQPDEIPGETSPRQEAAARIADLQEAPQQPPAEEAAVEEPVEDELPAEEEQPAAEHEAISEPTAPEASEEPLDEEPKEEGQAPEPSASGHSTEERHAIAEQPTEMYDIEEELSGTEPRISAEEDVEEDEDDDFWDEQRLSEELDQALEAPFDSDEEEPEEDEPDEDGPAPAAEEEDEVRASSSQEEDVLEETPDFLEESPEDDELWFEQKPPKDFDFDD